jgi:hypothetical protein
MTTQHPRARRLPKPDRRRALELLAACPEGCTVAIVRADLRNDGRNDPRRPRDRSQVHELHDLRNVIVHHFFEEEPDDRLSCDYLGKFGETVFSKLGTSKTDNSITYKEFDQYDAIASELYKKLCELLASTTPITEVSDELRDAMKEVIDSSIH